MKKSFIQRMISRLQGKTLTPFFFVGSCCREELLHSFEELDQGDLRLDHPVSHPSQADLLIIAGPVNFEQVELLMGVYQGMLNPKWVMALGACSLTGGNLHQGLVSRDISEVIAVDVKVEGCPPTVDSLKKGLEELCLLIEERSET